MSRPKTFRAGDRYSWEETLDDYDAATYTAKLRIIGSGGAQTVTATGSGTTYTFAFTVTANLPAGQYRLVLWVEETADVTKQYTQLDIPIALLANYADASTNFDTRSDTRIMYDSLVAAIKEAMALPYDQVAGHMRSLGYRSLDEMLKARDKLKAELRNEDADASGQVHRGTYYAKFTQ